MNDQIRYYKNRALEYEIVYNKPERQIDLSNIKRLLSLEFIGKNILEIACGTGYWTELISKQAKFIEATDINFEVLEVAKSKLYSNEVLFLEKNYLDYINEQNQFEGFFGGFIWSHILLENLDEFINILLNQVASGSNLIFIDNIFVEGNSTKLNRTDKFGNTYQIRTLKNLDTFEVIKNFPTKDFLYYKLKDLVYNFEFIALEYYWILKFTKI
ncbi:MAG: methyltransferase domain-containing protein [Chitinophagales bacterium]